MEGSSFWSVGGEGGSGSGDEKDGGEETEVHGREDGETAVGWLVIQGRTAGARR